MAKAARESEPPAPGLDANQSKLGPQTGHNPDWFAPAPDGRTVILMVERAGVIPTGD